MVGVCWTAVVTIATAIWTSSTTTTSGTSRRRAASRGRAAVCGRSGAREWRRGAAPPGPRRGALSPRPGESEGENRVPVVRHRSHRGTPTGGGGSDTGAGSWRLLCISSRPAAALPLQESHRQTLRRVDGYGRSGVGVQLDTVELAAQHRGADHPETMLPTAGGLSGVEGQRQDDPPSPGPRGRPPRGPGRRPGPASHRARRTPGRSRRGSGRCGRPGAACRPSPGRHRGRGPAPRTAARTPSSTTVPPVYWLCAGQRQRAAALLDEAGPSRRCRCARCRPRRSRRARRPG